MAYDYKVYLIGQMTDDPATYEWRFNVQRLYNHSEQWHDKVQFLNPSSTVFSEAYQGIPKKYPMSDTMIDRANELWKMSSNFIVPSDRNFVKQSDLAIANLNHYDKRTPMIGTIFELAWYYDSPEKAVIAIFDGDPKKDYLCRHPFVQKAVDVWVYNWEEACEVLNHHMVK